MKCYNCNNEITKGGLYCKKYFCIDCLDKIPEFLRRPPSLKGMSDGPSSCNSELIFDRPDPAKDIPLTLKKMEDAGQLNDPSAMAAAKVKMDEAKGMERQNIDYQIKGHPLED